MCYSRYSAASECCGSASFDAESDPDPTFHFVVNPVPDSTQVLHMLDPGPDPTK
jgi:hypothetical protein